MKIGDLVSFHSENFFEGAVQLRWVTERPEQAKQAANAFVFHGPRYHGAADAETDGIAGGYRLKDSASFVHELLGSIQGGLRGEEHNPYWLVVAGYGSGKSHLALTCSTLLAEPTSATAQSVIANISKADEGLGLKVRQAVDALERPALVITLDGMSGFHLGNALTQATLAQLQQHGADTGAVLALSPRFQLAEQFVERNYGFRASRFAERLPGMGAESICAHLRNNDEDVYAAVDELYSETNGSHIPVVGQESAQELLNTLCEVYCGPEGAFSNVVIMFDEFGRYLEYAAEKPLLAGDAALQQVFQGVQDNSNKIRFVGFIQYELKAYLKRFGSADLRQLQRYITRFDSAQKWYLSTNLETLFAHMIGKKQAALDGVWQDTSAQRNNEAARQLMNHALPGYGRFPVWTDPEKFSRVIAQGCWPLHPLATWFLTRQRDVVQSRSALTFIKEMVERIAPEEVVTAGRLRQVSAAELVLQSMLPEMIAAERETGGVVAETLQLLLEKFQAHLTADQRLALAGVAILERMRVGRLDQEHMNRLLAETCALPLQQLDRALAGLSQELGVIEWNRDLGQYELIADASTRGQFQQWLRQQQAKLNGDVIRDLFMRRGALDMGLETLLSVPDFAQHKQISTPDWHFKPHLAHSQNIGKVVAGAFQDWKKASLPTDPKGNVIYLYIQPNEDVSVLDAKVHAVLQKELNNATASNAPVWVIGLNDASASLAEHIGRLYLFDEKITEVDRERFRRFVPEEKDRSERALKELVQDVIKQRLFWMAGFSSIPAGRLKHVGEAVFEAVYPQTVPFPFDGFASSVGAGAADCAQLTRSLVSRQVNGAWIQAQPKRMQNRVMTLLAQSWGSLRTSGQLAEPTTPQAKVAYEHLLKLHQGNPGQTLLQSYQMLLAPPYGMNAASAGLLLGLLLGLETPPRRIEYDHQMVAAGDWLTDAFPAQKGRHFLDQATLGKSAVRFLSADAAGRWRQLLNQWEAEQQYEAIIHLTDEVEKTRKIEPLPESMEGLYRVLLDRANKVQEQIHDAQKKLDLWERDIEHAERQDNVGHLLKVGSLLLRQQAVFAEQDCWPAQMHEDNQKLLALVKEFVAQRIAAWIPRQGCNSIVQVSEYNQRMEKAVASLKNLGFTTESQKLENLSRESVAQIEEREKHRVILDRSNDYPLQPEPTDSTPVRTLRDEIATGDALVEGIRQTYPVLKQDEINSRVTAIQQRQVRLREAVRRHTEALGKIFTQSIATQAELEETLVRVKRLQNIFVGTPDAQEVQDLNAQLERVRADVSAWECQDVGVERLEELLQHQVQGQLAEFNNYLQEQEIDPAWEMSVLYLALAAERMEAARKRSADWLAPRLELRSQVSGLDRNRCANLERELQAAPGYLAQKDQEKVTEILHLVSQRRKELEEDTCSKQVKAWLAEFLALQNLTALSQPETERWLKSLRNPPQDAKPDELSVLQPLETQLTAHLDQMSMDEIIARIERLPVKAQRKLALLLSQRLMEQQDA
ncbi:hypothetical protein VSS37_21480 [Candidatus Thiothrix sp. Deng01]|uniref:ATP-binding protein n=1 Tax=Candidatus Thiothrix phosphatis TaxID=3112415 RepID=A0ABU6D3B1_9GAMM|nr:hypothetical protein [Candidatus Thiothrix sp. Deng01]MEB4593564.1 hypothetical protein [Candidatus Thiothrix sp. Deng01]